jgi:hypothetical protein
MSHVRIERFTAGDDEEHGAQHSKSNPSSGKEELQSVPRIECGQNTGLTKNSPHTQNGNR